MNFKQWLEQDYAGDFENDPSHIFGRGTSTHVKRGTDVTMDYSPQPNSANAEITKLRQDLEAIQTRLAAIEQSRKPNVVSMPNPSKTLPLNTQTVKLQNPTLPPQRKQVAG